MYAPIDQRWHISAFTEKGPQFAFSFGIEAWDMNLDIHTWKNQKQLNDCLRQMAEKLTAILLPNETLRDINFITKTDADKQNRQFCNTSGRKYTAHMHLFHAMQDCNEKITYMINLNFAMHDIERILFREQCIDMLNPLSARIYLSDTPPIIHG